LINTKTEYMGKLEKDLIKAADNIFNGIKWGLIIGAIVGLIMILIFYSILSV